MPTLTAGSIATVYAPVASDITITPGLAGRASVNGRNTVSGAAVTPREVYSATTIRLAAGDQVSIEAVNTDATYTDPAGMDTSLQSLVSRGGNAAAARARDKINLNNRPALIQAPVWVTATPYVLGDVRRLSTGQLICCVTAGTSGGAEPTFSAVGQMTDNTAIWWSIGRNSRTPPSGVPVPTVTEVAGIPASALRYNLFEHQNRFSETLIPPSNIKSLFGSTPDIQSGGWLFRNSAALDNGFGADGTQGYNRTIEFYTDSDVVDVSNLAATTLANRAQVFVSETGAIEDEYAVNEATPTPGATGSPRHFKFTYTTAGGRKLRRWRIETWGSIRCIGFVAGSLVLPAEVTGVNLLWYGDSYHQTVTPQAAQFNYDESLAIRTGRRLGFRQIRVAAIGGTGYVKNGVSGEYTLQQVLDNTNLSYVRADAVVCAHGYNDCTFATPAATAEAAIQAWRTIRQQQPNAVIVVVGPWSARRAADAVWIAMDVALQAAFLEWGDARSGWISPMTGTVITSAGGSVATLTGAQPFVSGTGFVGATTANGNSDWLTASDGIHPSPAGKVHLEMLLTSTIERVLSGMAPPL